MNGTELEAYLRQMTRPMTPAEIVEEFRIVGDKNALKTNIREMLKVLEKYDMVERFGEKYHWTWMWKG